jgi:hypothetical protein
MSRRCLQKQRKGADLPRGQRLFFYPQFSHGELTMAHIKLMQIGLGCSGLVKICQNCNESLANSAGKYERYLSPLEKQQTVSPLQEQHRCPF